MSKEEAHKRSFKQVKEDVGKVLSNPLLRPSLEEALRFPLLEQKEQEARFGFLVEENAQRCLFGVPEDEITGEFICNYLIESLDQLSPRSTSAGACRRSLWSRKQRPYAPMPKRVY